MRERLPPGPRAQAIRKWRARLRARRRPRLKGISFNRMLPNLLTLIGLCFGLTAIRFALEGRFPAAATAIVVAGVIDGLDGRLARLLKGTSRFGAEFDSLSDFLCFGVAPALVLYIWTLESWRGLGYAPCLLFAVCTALRLARFNSALDAGPLPAYRQHFFTGVPAPAGAMLGLFPLFAALAAAEWGVVWLASALAWPGFSALVLVGVGLLMVSQLPAWSFKNFRVPEALALPLLIGVGLYVAFLVSEPWAAMALGGLAYVGMLPFSLRSYRRLKAEAEAIAEPVVGPAPPVAQPRQG
ncbi:MAG: phosphatidylcholine/phosphatidylserine synthase [Acetobacteraceae bacterium]|nr:phosphatidylcholine/phosphatidylserine synthase [Acetobacteraceae bacterium]